jgi:hypothetical protein
MQAFVDYFIDNSAEGRQDTLLKGSQVCRRHRLLRAHVATAGSCVSVDDESS